MSVLPVTLEEIQAFNAENVPFSAMMNISCDSAPSEQDIMDWVEDRVAHFKQLKGGVIFTDTIPKSASGKILRRILRDQLKGDKMSE